MRPFPLIALCGALGLAACASTPAYPPAEAAARLPAQLAGLRKGNVVPTQDGGQEVGYSTNGRFAAGATVEITRPGRSAFPDGPATSQAGQALAQAIAEQTLPAPGRSVRETGRFTLPANDPVFSCAGTSGRLGRQPVEGLLCAGGVGGNLVQLRAAQPSRNPPPADLRAFATALANALRSP
jgi:hypothetical protein